MLTVNDTGAFERIKSEIIRKAEEEAEEIIRKAEEEAEEIIRKAEEKAREEEERIKREAKPKLDGIRHKILWESIAESRKKQLNVREELIKRVFNRVESEIVQMVAEKGKEYEKLLISLIIEGAKGISESKIHVASNKRDAKFLKAHIETLSESMRKSLGYNVEITLTEDQLDCIGGVIVYSQDKKLIYHNLLESRLLKAKEKLRLKVGRILFKQ